MAEQPDIIEQGHRRPPRAIAALVLPRRAIVVVAGTTAVVVAGSVLAVARPWVGSAGLPSPCTLMPAAVVADLVPAAASTPVVIAASTSTTRMCTWRTTGGTLLSLDVEYAPGKTLAQQEFAAMPGAAGPVPAAVIRPLPGIGDRAQAVTATGSTDQVAVYVRVLSGATLLGIGYNSPRTGRTSPPSDQAVLAQLIPASRTALSRLRSSLAQAQPVVARRAVMIMRLWSAVSGWPSSPQASTAANPAASSQSRSSGKPNSRLTKFT